VVSEDDRCCGQTDERDGIRARPVVERVVVVSPRGYCAGVERAIECVERALQLWGAPVYVRRQIVHNRQVVSYLEARGAIFVESEEDVPEGERLVFSAHGVAPAVVQRSRARGLRTIDATCPLVAKVHAEVQRFAAAGYLVFVIGHAGHDEVVGTMGVAPTRTILVETIADAETIEPGNSEQVAYVTQTTLSVDDTATIVDTLRRRFPEIVGPPKEDICYATTNRQRAVKAVLAHVGFLVVVGSRNSSNSNRLVETALDRGVRSALVDDASELDEAWFQGVVCAGLTSGASVPERLVVEACDWFRARGAEVLHQPAAREDVFFRLPVEVRRKVEAQRP
jgi:4-hydroxy-3-methylbut-2-enyl diphosphate reductase